MKIAGGKLKSLDETGAPPGTTVSVGDLFFNVPARKKFLRAISTETDHVVDTLSRLALPHTDIHFRLDDGEKMVLNLPSSETLSNRLAALLSLSARLPVRNRRQARRESESTWRHQMQAGAKAIVFLST